MSIPESLSPTEQRAYDLITARDRLSQSAL